MINAEATDMAIANAGIDNSSALNLLQKEIKDSDILHRDLFFLNPILGRRMVSFQANKSAPVYRLFKYKEGFSAALVEYMIDHLQLEDGPILDPFSGTGTTSIVSASRSIPSTGIELLPIGNLIANARAEIMDGISADTIDDLHSWNDNHVWEECAEPDKLLTLRITNGAYPDETEYRIRQYLSSIGEAKTNQARMLLLFALCSILEEISYTRKDGQYLRWDFRSNRRSGKKPFNKGAILSFDEAIKSKLDSIIADAQNTYRPDLFRQHSFSKHDVNFLQGSCLKEMMNLDDSSYEAVITSPPYCNRYDYTRTYALELAVLGIDERHLIDLRQTMLSCTVENRAKDLLSMNPDWEPILDYCKSHSTLSSILEYLYDLKSEGRLNNNGIPRMVEGYFNEMACVTYECSRVLRREGYVAMVNDNVRYAGVPIPVDTILSDIAEHCGMKVDSIMILPTGKGNSSQQMGEHGRSVLRKCVYIWKKL